MFNSQGLYPLYVNVKVPEEQVAQDKMTSLVSTMRLHLSIRIIKSTLAA